MLAPSVHTDGRADYRKSGILRIRCAPVAQGIERCLAEAEVGRSNRPGRIENERASAPAEALFSFGGRT